MGVGGEYIEGMYRRPLTGSEWNCLSFIVCEAHLLQYRSHVFFANIE